MLQEIVKENIGKTCPEVQKFLQELVARRELKAHQAKEHPQINESTEDEIIIRQKRGLLLAPTKNVKEYYAFAVDTKNGYVYNIHFGHPWDLYEADWHVTTIARLVKNFDLRKLDKKPFEDARVVIPEEMIEARLKIEYLADKEKVEGEWELDNPGDKDKPFGPDSTIIEGEQDELFTKILEFVKKGVMQNG